MHVKERRRLAVPFLLGHKIELSQCGRWCASHIRADLVGMCAGLQVSCSSVLFRAQIQSEQFVLLTRNIFELIVCCISVQDHQYLAVSRSFGDTELKHPTQLVVCTPEIRVFDIMEEDSFFVLCCDGVFDVLGSFVPFYRLDITRHSTFSCCAAVWCFMCQIFVLSSFGLPFRKRTHSFCHTVVVCSMGSKCVPSVVCTILCRRTLFWVCCDAVIYMPGVCDIFCCHNTVQEGTL